MNICFGQRPQRGRPPARQHPRARRHRAAPHTLQLQGLQAGHQGHLHRTLFIKSASKIFRNWHFDCKTFEFLLFFQRDYTMQSDTIAI
jgi:hypothetical protein